MPTTVTRPIANARQDPPWSDCGDPRSPDLGHVFVRSVANGAVALTFDSSGRRHALTLFDGAQLGTDIIVYGRRFVIVRSPEGH